jgi:hypothetical protein
LPAASPEWDMGIKIHKRVIVDRVTTLVKQSIEDLNIVQNVDIISVDFSTADQTIRAVADATFQKSQDFDYLPHKSVTVGVNVEVHVDLACKAEIRSANQLWIHAESGEISIQNVTLDPDWANKIPGVDDFAKSVAEELLAKYPPDQQVVNERVLNYDGAQKLGVLIDVDRLVLFVVIV